MAVIGAEENDDNKVLVYVKGRKKCNNSIATTRLRFWMLIMKIYGRFFT